MGEGLQHFKINCEITMKQDKIGIMIADIFRIVIINIYISHIASHTSLS